MFLTAANIHITFALKYMHGQNYLHLDVKPNNIMVDENEHATLIDFGMGNQYDMLKVENPSVLLGETSVYIPLEQIGNEVENFLPAIDIYALGATFYKIVTGITPISALQIASGEELNPLPFTISDSTKK